MVGPEVPAPEPEVPLGRLGEVQVSLAQTERPWSLDIDGLVVSAAPDGPGQLLAAAVRALQLDLRRDWLDIAPLEASSFSVHHPRLRSLIVTNVRRPRMPGSAAQMLDPAAAVKAAYVAAGNVGCSSIGVPLLGTGALRADALQSARDLLRGLAEISQEPSLARAVTRVVLIARNAAAADAFRTGWSGIEIRGAARRGAGSTRVGAASKFSESILPATPRTGSAVGGAFVRFSPEASLALSDADAARRADGADAVHVEHLLLGLANDRDGRLARVVRRLEAAETGDVTGGIAAFIGSKAALPMRSREPLTALPELSGHAEQAIEAALQLATSERTRDISASQLLRGVLSLRQCSAVRRLESYGIDSSAFDEPTGGDDPPGGRSGDAPSEQHVGASPRAPLLAGATADTVPEPGEGRVRSADRLGTASEVEMLVSVLLAEETPLPLAVGLFGDWGSGKSFFMALMEERMAELADLARQGRPEAEPFCKEVRCVRFNAWHYVDTDLWASLAATLFDVLARDDSTQRAQEMLDKLSEARDRFAQSGRARETLERELEQLSIATDRAAAAVRPSISVAIRAVREDKHLIDGLRHASQGEVTGPSATTRLVSALERADTFGARLRVAWRLTQEEILHRRRASTVVTLSLLVVIAVALGVIVGWPPAGTFFTAVGAVIAGLSPAVEAAIRTMHLAREAREARELPLVEKREEVERAIAAQQAAMRDIEKHEKELAQLRDKGTQLREFVRERAASPDYRSRLGTISSVRRDFEQLVAFLPHAGAPGAKDVAAVAGEAAKRSRNIQRIVLFIDDLDRCPHEKVVEVLQAVHLLLAFKLFVVVVGVDSRWLERSLLAHYANLLDEPADYLEKIFQIPYTIRRMDSSRYRDLITELTPPHVGGGGMATDRSAHDPKNLRDDQTAAPTERPPADSADLARHELLDAVHVAEVKAPAVGDVPAGHLPTRAAPLPRPEALIISEDERALLAALDGVELTPRATKRLVNIYRMLRVGVQEDELESFDPDGDREFEAVVVLLGIMIGHAEQSENVFSAIRSAPDGTDLLEVLARFPAVHASLEAVLTQIRSTSVEPYRRWAPRVARFSFRLAGTQLVDADFPAAPRPR